MSRKNYIFFGFLIIIFLIRLIGSKEKIPENTNTRITYKVLSEPIVYEKNQYLKIKGLKTYLPKYPEINYGDKIVVEGLSDGGRLKDAKLVSIIENKNLLYKVREKIVNFYRRSLPEPIASLTAGVVLGSKSSIPEKFWEDLKISGTAHVVVASGMNVSLIAGFITNFLILVTSRKKAVIITIVTIWIYALISGFDAPIIRASIMGTIAFSAVILGRVYSALYALLVSAAFMLIIKPVWIYDVGFILSFVATMSLILFEKIIKQFINFLPGVFKEGLSTSLSAQIGVAPILFLTFGQFNILSPIINAFVLWTIAPITIIAMISGILSLVFEPIARLVLYISYPLSLYFVKVVELFSF